MIYLTLFLTFLKIGAVSFGGGYGMISLIKEEVVLINKWASEELFLNLVAVSESSPGPIAVNMATFIGATASGDIWGSLLSTLGVIIPSFFIILIISIFIKGILKYKGVQGVLQGIRPVIAGLITATGLTLVISVILNVKTVDSKVIFDYKALIIFAIIIAVDLIVKKVFKKKISPILLIILSAVLGLVLYSF